MERHVLKVYCFGISDTKPKIICIVLLFSMFCDEINRSNMCCRNICWSQSDGRVHKLLCLHVTARSEYDKYDASLVNRLMWRTGLRLTSRWPNWKLFVSVSSSTFATSRSTDSSQFQHWPSTSQWRSRRRALSPSTRSSNIQPRSTCLFSVAHRSASKTSYSKCSKSTDSFCCIAF